MFKSLLFTSPKSKVKTFPAIVGFTGFCVVDIDPDEADDIDSDGEVGLFDLVIMKDQFGRNDCDVNPCDADINGCGYAT